MTVSPWTQYVNVSWPAQLSFYERRIEILRSLEDEGLLRSFMVGENRIGARIGDNNHEMVVEGNSLTIKILEPDEEPQRMEYAASVALEKLKPRSFRRITVSLQYVVPLAAGYDESRLQTAESLLRVDDNLKMNDWDWAILLDGSSQSSNSAFQIEFGIVEKKELPRRLSRFAGRVQGHEVSPEQWADVEFPDVAFFGDSTWTPQVSEEPATLATLLNTWSSVLEDSERLMSHLLSLTEPRPGIPT